VRQGLLVLLAVFAVGCGLETGGQLGGGPNGDQKYETVPSPTEPPPGQGSNVDTGGQKSPRVSAGVLALYNFNEGSGSEVFDTSGRIPSTPLKIVKPPSANWESGFLRLKTPNALVPSNDSVGVITAIKASNTFTVEAWVTPASTTTLLSRLVGAGPSGIFANFTLGADDTSLYLATRTSLGDPQTVSALSIVFTAKLMHVVATRDSDGLSKIYVDGAERSKVMLPGNLSTWDTSYPLTIANAPSNDRPWLGDIHLVALYDRSLSADEVKQNFTAGP